MNLKEKEWLTNTEELQATYQQLEELGSLLEARRIKGRTDLYLNLALIPTLLH